jgi:hypothetical protein
MNINPALLHPLNTVSHTVTQSCLPVLPVNDADPRVARGLLLAAVVGKLDEAAFPGGVHHPLLVALEEEGAVELVVALAAAVGLVLRDDFAQVLSHEGVTLHVFTHEAAEPVDV